MRRPRYLAVASRSLALVLLLGGWVAIVAIGLTALWRYELAAGEPGTPPARWPKTSAIATAPGRPTLVMWLHPRCPCSSASVEELDRLIARVGDRVAVHVMFEDARGGDDAAEPALWTRAASIRGVRALRDVGGIEARRFEAWTSGQTVLYGADGRLRFAGGITGSRGHAGDNPGQEALVAAIFGEAGTMPNAPVYGCALRSSSSSAVDSAEAG
jgi:hypothetical protein